jgi:hypothetical protein
MVDRWSDIPAASQPTGRTERLADSDHPLDFFMGRDFDGRHLFWLRAPWSGEDLPKSPTISGMDVECRPEGADLCNLSLTLRDSAQLEIFQPLCANLMQATRHLGPADGKAAIGATLARLQRWQELLSRRRDRVLTRQQIIGLVGELFFLRDDVMPRMSVGEAVLSWRGPFGDEQDFVFDDRIVEIKSQLATADRRIQISSENQLDTVSGPIALIHRLLGAGTGDPSARSLNGLVDEIVETISAGSPDANDLLQIALLEAGYIRRSEYDEEQWVAAGSRIYEIRIGFPALVAGGLPPGVSKVRYEISPPACSDYEQQPAWLEGFIRS